MTNFWDSNVWGFLNLFAVLLVSLLAANALKYVQLCARSKNIARGDLDDKFLGL